MTALSADDVKKCTELFEKYDKDKSGSLTLNEILPMVEDLGWEKEMVTEEKVKKWFSDSDCDKGIAKDQFLKAYEKNPIKDRRLAHLQRTFKEVDTDKSGSVSVDELKEGIMKCFPWVNLDDCEWMVEQGGKGGQIMLTDFVKYFQDSHFFDSE